VDWFFFWVQSSYWWSFKWKLCRHNWAPR
jgi:hypothetical protein